MLVNVNRGLKFVEGRGILSPKDLRDNTKERIIVYIAEHKNGAKPHEIARGVGVTRQYVHRLLKELMKVRKVYNKNQLYFNNDHDLGNILSFARYMKYSSDTFADLIQINRTINHTEDQNYRQDVYHDMGSLLFKPVDEIVSSYPSTVSEKYCKRNFQEDELYERILFEFVNRVGAFIAYIFLEAMRPSTEHNSPTMKPAKKDELSNIMIQRSIDITKMFEKFRDFPLDTVNRGREFTNNTFEKISHSFKKVYPGIYNSLEEGWSDSVNASIGTQTALASEKKYSMHKHKWEEFRIYKLKDRKDLLCRGCGNIVNKEI